MADAAPTNHLKPPDESSGPKGTLSNTRTRQSIASPPPSTHSPASSWPRRPPSLPPVKDTDSTRLPSLIQVRQLPQASTSGRGPRRPPIATLPDPPSAPPKEEDYDPNLELNKRIKRPPAVAAVIPPPSLPLRPDSPSKRRSRSGNKSRQANMNAQGGDNYGDQGRNYSRVPFNIPGSGSGPLFSHSQRKRTKPRSNREGKEGGSRDGYTTSRFQRPASNATTDHSSYNAGSFSHRDDLDDNKNEGRRREDPIKAEQLGSRERNSGKVHGSTSTSHTSWSSYSPSSRRTLDARGPGGQSVSASTSRNRHPLQSYDPPPSPFQSSGRPKHRLDQSSRADNERIAKRIRTTSRSPPVRPAHSNPEEESAAQYMTGDMTKLEEGEQMLSLWTDDEAQSFRGVSVRQVPLSVHDEIPGLQEASISFSNEIVAASTDQYKEQEFSLKRETSPINVAPPIDVDAPPVSLYEQLGLPIRTSGALRVPRPAFAKNDSVRKELWSREIVDSIRWARGRDNGIPPLIVGNIFWRPDGVSFDWEISAEEIRGQNDLAEAESSLVPALQRSSILSSPAKSRPREPSSLGECVGSSEPTARERRRLDQQKTQNTQFLSEPEPTDFALRIRSPPSADLEWHFVAHPAPGTTGPTAEREHVTTPGYPMSASFEAFADPIFESTDAMSNIATCFLDRYTRCFDHVKSRAKLADAYTEDATMTIQFNDLPSEGVCLRVGQPNRQSHLIVNFAEREDARNLLTGSDRDSSDWQYDFRYRRTVSTGREAIVTRLGTFEALTHAPSATASRSYAFTMSPLKEYGLLLLDYQGDLYATKPNSEDRYLSLRFHRTFILKRNDPDSPAWIDWPWTTVNDQLTLFHRPGIVCQCPP